MKSEEWWAGTPAPVPLRSNYVGGSLCPPDNFHLLCVKEIHAVFETTEKSEISKFVILSVAKNPINKGKDSSALPQNDRSFYFFSGF